MKGYPKTAKATMKPLPAPKKGASAKGGSARGDKKSGWPSGPRC